MIDFLNQLINGLSLGTFYALIALGYTMVYGVLRFINFAHGDIFMIGAFVGYYTAGRVVPLFGGRYVLLGIVGLVLVAMVVCAALGIIIEKLAYRPLRSRPKLTVLITAIGVSLLLEYGGQFVFGPDPKPFLAKVPDPYNSNLQDLGNPIDGIGNFLHIKSLNDLILSPNQIVVFGVTISLLIALNFIVKRTKLGMAMRAVSNNATAAALMGVNTDTVISFTFGLGSALAGAAGILFAISYPTIDPLMGVLPGIKAFVAAVLGGIGNIPGAALGGLIIGIVETFVAGSSLSTYRDAIAFAILILILLVKPAGLLGKSQVEKV